jgi:cytochrome oxidase Cu insertion factor (SCO1/SenC/PrrC family)
MSRLAAMAFMMLAIAGPALAQQPPAPPGSGQATPRVVNVQALGPQVGARIPDFTLVDQSGTPRTLRSLMGSKGLMLVLFRSADW